MVDTKPLQTNLKGPSKAKKIKRPNSTPKSGKKGQRSSGRR
jgi:hypothetical protein